MADTKTAEPKAKEKGKPYSANIRVADSGRHPPHGSYKLDENDRAGPVFAKPYGSEPLEQPAVTYDDESGKAAAKPQAKATR